jgi:hypothetical protein
MRQSRLMLAVLRVTQRSHLRCCKRHKSGAGKAAGNTGAAGAAHVLLPACGSMACSVTLRASLHPVLMYGSSLHCMLRPHHLCRSVHERLAAAQLPCLIPCSFLRYCRTIVIAELWCKGCSCGLVLACGSSLCLRMPCSCSAGALCQLWLTCCGSFGVKSAELVRQQRLCLAAAICPAGASVVSSVCQHWFLSLEGAVHLQYAASTLQGTASNVQVGKEVLVAVLHTCCMLLLCITGRHC